VTAPTFLILGAPKCGTTALHHALARHPDVFMAPDKDPLFFELDAEYERGPEAYWKRHFAAWRGEAAVGEARPTKLMLPYVPDRVRHSFPDVRLVAILRDPADRAFSHWWMRRCNGLEALGFAEALEANAAAIDAGRTFEGPAGIHAWREHLDPAIPTPPVYLEFGAYAAQLARWRERFDRERIRVLLFDDWKRDPDGVLRDLLPFLGVDPDRAVPGRAVYNAALPPAALPGLALDRRLGLSRLVPERLRHGLKELLSRNASAPRLDAGLRRCLVERYDDDVRSLERMLERDLSAWRSP
jgi:hypothetical protein